MSSIHQPGALHSEGKPAAKTIKYSGGVVHGSGVGGTLLDRPNLVSQYQKIYQAGLEPVFMKTPRDRFMFKGLMYGSLIGITFCLAGMYKIAMPKKN